MKALLRMPGVRGTRSSFIMQAIKSDLAWAPEKLAPQAPAKARK
jgi:Lrp/AsnC family leucine-responsive transcriptional regulator